MKDFFQFREEQTQLNESAMTDALNDLQDFWNENPEHNMEIGVLPMLSRPMDRVVKGGILVVGINPGNTKWTAPQRKAIYDLFSGEQPPVWNAKQRRWRQVDVGRSLPKGTKGGRGEKEMRYSQVSDDWEKRGGDPKSPYINNLRDFFKKIGRPDLVGGRSLMMANLVPFASNDESALNKMKDKSRMMAMSRKWMDEFIKETKPKAIITMGGLPWKELVAREVPEQTVNAVSSKGLTTNSKGKSLGKVLKVGYSRSGVPILGFAHPSGSRTANVNTKNYTSAGRIKLIRNIVDEYIPS